MKRPTSLPDESGNATSQEIEDSYYADQESRSDAEREYEAEASEREFYESLPDSCVSGQDSLCLHPLGTCKLCYNL